MIGTADEPERDTEQDDTVEMDPVTDGDGEQEMFPEMREWGATTTRPHPPRSYTLAGRWCALRHRHQWLVRFAAGVAHRLTVIGDRRAPSAA